jgi:hypothetical protein
MPAHINERNGSRNGLHVLPSRDQGPAGPRALAGAIALSVRRHCVFADLRDEVVLESQVLDQIELRFEPVDVLF